MNMSIGLLDHYNVSTRNLAETIKFYESVLGFVNGPRPPFAFPGAWLYSGDHPVLHLNDISPTDREQRPDSGVIDHVAFGSDFDGATIPAGNGDAAGQQNLVAALAADGFGSDDLAKICRENWLRVLAQTWREV